MTENSKSRGVRLVALFKNPSLISLFSEHLSCQFEREATVFAIETLYRDARPVSVI